VAGLSGPAEVEVSESGGNGGRTAGCLLWADRRRSHRSYGGMSAVVCLPCLHEAGYVASEVGQGQGEKKPEIGSQVSRHGDPRNLLTRRNVDQRERLSDSVLDADERIESPVPVPGCAVECYPPTGQDQVAIFLDRRLTRDGRRSSPGGRGPDLRLR
jgi:hypothetical protein